MAGGRIVLLITSPRVGPGLLSWPAWEALRAADLVLAADPEPGWQAGLAEAGLGTGLGEALVVGRASIDGLPCELSVMDFAFMGGSMGSVVGEKIARLFERAASLQRRSRS